MSNVAVSFLIADSASFYLDAEAHRLCVFSSRRIKYKSVFIIIISGEVELGSK